MSIASDFRQDYHTLVRSDVFSVIPRGANQLLDFGGGIGATAARLKELGYTKRAGVVDVIPEEKKSPKLDFSYCGDVEDLNFIKRIIEVEGLFDIILCLDVLEHLRDPWAVVAALHAGLTESGVIIASIPNIRNYKASLPLVFLNSWTMAESGILDKTHLRFFVRSTAIELMASSGLKIEEVVGIPSGGRKVKIFRAATLNLLNSFTDRQYLIRARNTR